MFHWKPSGQKRAVFSWPNFKPFMCLTAWCTTASLGWSQSQRPKRRPLPNAMAASVGPSKFASRFQSKLLVIGTPSVKALCLVTLGLNERFVSSHNRLKQTSTNPVKVWHGMCEANGWESCNSPHLGPGLWLVPPAEQCDLNHGSFAFVYFNVNGSVRENACNSISKGLRSTFAWRT